MTLGEASTRPAPRGLLTIDVEDWHHANFAQLDPHQDEVMSQRRATTYDMALAIDRWID